MVIISKNPKQTKKRFIRIAATKTLDTISGVLANVDVWPNNRESLIMILQGYAALFHHAAVTFDALVLIIKRKS